MESMEEAADQVNGVAEPVTIDGGDADTADAGEPATTVDTQPE